MERERTLILLKPDTIERNLVGEVINRIEKTGMRIAGIKMVKMTDELLAEHYSHLVDKPFFNDLKEFMMETPVIALVIDGLEAVKRVRMLAGPTNPREAMPGTIRGDYSTSTRKNVIHASGTVEEAKSEIERFFKKDEVFDYTRKNAMDYIYE